MIKELSFLTKVLLGIGVLAILLVIAGLSPSEVRGQVSDLGCEGTTGENCGMTLLTVHSSCDVLSQRTPYVKLMNGDQEFFSTSTTEWVHPDTNNPSQVYSLHVYEHDINTDSFEETYLPYSVSQYRVKWASGQEQVWTPGQALFAFPVGEAVDNVDVYINNNCSPASAQVTLHNNSSITTTYTVNGAQYTVGAANSNNNQNDHIFEIAGNQNVQFVVVEGNFDISHSNITVSPGDSKLVYLFGGPDGTNENYAGHAEIVFENTGVWLNSSANPASRCSKRMLRPGFPEFNTPISTSVGGTPNTPFQTGPNAPTHMTFYHSIGYNLLNCLQENAYAGQSTYELRIPGAAPNSVLGVPNREIIHGFNFTYRFDGYRGWLGTNAYGQVTPQCEVRSVNGTHNEMLTKHDTRTGNMGQGILPHVFGTIVPHRNLAPAEYVLNCYVPQNQIPMNYQDSSFAAAKFKVWQNSPVRVLVVREGTNTPVQMDQLQIQTRRPNIHPINTQTFTNANSALHLELFHENNTREVTIIKGTTPTGYSSCYFPNGSTGNTYQAQNLTPTTDVEVIITCVPDNVLELQDANPGTEFLDDISVNSSVLRAYGASRLHADIPSSSSRSSSSSSRSNSSTSRSSSGGRVLGATSFGCESEECLVIAINNQCSEPTSFDLLHLPQYDADQLVLLANVCLD